MRLIENKIALITVSQQVIDAGVPSVPSRCPPLRAACVRFLLFCSFFMILIVVLNMEYLFHRYNQALQILSIINSKSLNYQIDTLK